jgi:hypothetical protein
MGKHPFSAQNEGALIRKIMRGDFERPSGYSRPLMSLVLACLTYDHKSRPSAAALLARPDVNKMAHNMGLLPLKQPSGQRHGSAQKHELGLGHGLAARPDGDHGHNVHAHSAGLDAHPFALQPAQHKDLVRNHGCHTVKCSQATRGRQLSTDCTSCLQLPPPVQVAAEMAALHLSADRPASEAIQAVPPSHPNSQDHVQQLLHMPETAISQPPGAGRLEPVKLPPAGAVCMHSQHSSPFAKDGSAWVGRGEGGNDPWKHAYERPQFARRRCPDLMVTGPNPRAAAPTPGKPVKAPGYYAYEGSVHTSTSYMRGTNT